MAVWNGIINDWTSLEVTYTESNIDTANNTSDVTVAVAIVATSGSWDSYANNLNVKINNVLKANINFTYDFRDGSRRKNLGSWTQKVTHNADGSFSCPIYVKATMVDDADPELNSSFVLTNIPRATTPTAPNSATMGDTITIATPRASSAFTHKLYYKFGSDTAWNLIASGVTTSHNWAIPNIASKLPNAVSGALQIRCETYNGSTLVGTKDISNTTLSVPSTYLPTASTPTLTGVSTLSGNYVQGKSSAKGTGGGSGSNGSTIKTSTITFKAGAKVLGSGASPYTSPVINDTGTITVINTVTDSRGRSASASTTFTVLPYSAPKITSFTAQRCTAAGVIDGTGEYMKFTGGSSITPVNNANGKNTRIQYRAVGSTSWINAGSDTTNYNGVVNSAVIAAAPDTRYEVQMLVSDSYSTSPSTLIVPTIKIALSAANSERGVAVGKDFNESDPGNLQVAGPATFDGKVHFYDGIQPQLINGKDLNTVTETGFYYGSTMTNAAVSDISIVQVMKYNNDWITQIQYMPNSNGGSIYQRVRHSGTTWSPWKEIQTIVESGTNSNGTYVKYADGTMECYMSRIDTAVPITTALSGWYRNDTLAPCVYPATFVGIPSVTFSANGSGFMGYATIYSIGAGSIIVRLINPTSITSDISTRYIAKGRWK